MTQNVKTSLSPRRCPWATSDPEMIAYHDQEWGSAIHGEAAWFERLSLEAFQSGLSWMTILRKRDNFRAAFAGFDPDRVAAFTESDVERLMSDVGIVRNRAKILATIANAAAVVRLRGEGGLEAVIRAHTPDVRPSPGATTTPASTALAAQLARHGFRFVGPTTMHALMQATGLFDPHVDECFRRSAP